MVTIAVDAMGGDHAPKAEVEGAIRAARDLGVKVILVGQQDLVRRELQVQDGNGTLPIEIVSAGNTGAVMATAKIVQGVVPGVDRPALVGILPTAEGTPVVLVDVGANVDCTPRMLGQFAVMAEIYSRNILHRPNPRVGLLSIGEEEHKGKELTRSEEH